MKFLIVTLALLGVVAADVSHLNNEYLPPHIAKLSHTHVEYAQQSEEIPQVSTVEVTDNSLAEVASVAEDKEYFTGKIQIDNLNYGPAYAGEIKLDSEVPALETVTEEKKYYTGLVNNKHSGSTTTTTTTITASVPAPGSDTFTQQQAAYFTSLGGQTQEASVPAPGSDTFTQQQAAHWTSVSQQQEEQEVKVPEHKYYTGLIAPTGHNAGSGSASSSSSSSSTTTVVEQQAPEQQYYTGLVYKPGQESASTVTTTVSGAVPGSDDFTQQQAAYWTQQQPEAQPEPEKKYFTGLVYTPGQGSTVVEHSSQTVVIPGSDYFSQQQSAPALGASAGVETQYAADGGYVY